MDSLCARQKKIVDMLIKDFSAKLLPSYYGNDNNNSGFKLEVGKLYSFLGEHRQVAPGIRLKSSEAHLGSFHNRVLAFPIGKIDVDVQAEAGFWFKDPEISYLLKQLKKDPRVKSAYIKKSRITFSLLHLKDLSNAHVTTPGTKNKPSPVPPKDDYYMYFGVKEVIYSERYEHTSKGVTKVVLGKPEFKTFPCFYAIKANTLLAFTQVQCEPRRNDLKKPSAKRPAVFFDTKTTSFIDKKEQVAEKALSRFLQLESIS